MSLVLFQPAGAAELDEAYRWYERKRAGLGGEFLQAAQALIARVAENPLAFPLVHRDKRLLEIFQYNSWGMALHGSLSTAA